MPSQCSALWVAAVALLSVGDLVVSEGTDAVTVEVGPHGADGTGASAGAHAAHRRLFRERDVVRGRGRVAVATNERLGERAVASLLQVSGTSRAKTKTGSFCCCNHGYLFSDDLDKCVQCGSDQAREIGDRFPLHSAFQRAKDKAHEEGASNKTFALTKEEYRRRVLEGLDVVLEKLGVELKDVLGETVAQDDGRPVGAPEGPESADDFLEQLKYPIRLTVRVKVKDMDHATATLEANTTSNEHSGHELDLADWNCISRKVIGPSVHWIDCDRTPHIHDCY